MVGLYNNEGHNKVCCSIDTSGKLNDQLLFISELGETEF